MSGYRTAPAILLLDATGRPVGFKEQDGDETFFPTLSTDSQSLVMPGGSSVALAAAAGATATASEVLAARSLVYITAGGQLALANATAEGKEALAFVAAGYGAGAVATYSTIGATITGLAGLTPGATYYLSTTAGQLTITPPATTGNVVQAVGVALSGTSLLFAPHATVTL